MTAIRALACLIAIPVNPVTLAQEVANADVRVFGKLVLSKSLPADAQAEPHDLSLPKGVMALSLLPGHEEQINEMQGRPGNFHEMSEEDQRGWMIKAAGDPSRASCL